MGQKSYPVQRQPLDLTPQDHLPIGIEANQVKDILADTEANAFTVSPASAPWRVRKVRIVTPVGKRLKASLKSVSLGIFGLLFMRARISE